MDPLSISASVIALVGAVHKLSNLLGRAINVRNAPDVLLALNNEISDLHLVLDDVNDLLLASTQSIPPKSLGSALERVKSTVLQLEKFVAYELTTFDSAGRARVDKSTFLRKEQHLSQLKDDVRADRVVLGAALSLFASFISMQNDCHLRQTHCSIEMLHDRLNNLNIDQESSHTARGHDSELVVSRKVHNQHKSDPPTTIQVFKAVCDAGCHCTCHRYNRIRSPVFLNDVLGTLFIGYRANVSLRQACSDAACRSRANGIVCTYTFPSWLLKCAISMSHSSILSKGPELLLRLMRVRDFTPILLTILRNSESWSLDKLKMMLDTGLVSVLDIDNQGRSVLRYAVHQRKWSITRLLISYGADVNHESSDTGSPFIDAWTIRFRSEELPKDILEDWDKLFLQDRFQLDVFGFSNLHKAYLGLSGLGFEQVLELTDRSCIDNVDSLGRTVLYWAAYRGDSYTVAKLLVMGADPNKQDKLGITPLHCAVRIDPITSEILLDAKADPKILDPQGSTLLHWIRWNTACLIKRIVGLGVDVNKINECDSTALTRACDEDHSEVVRELLACGADINVCDGLGHSAVMKAIFNNSHKSLSILISNPSADLSIIDSKGWGIAALAARSSDLQSLEILSNEWPAGVNFGKGSIGDLAWKCARYRRDENETWARMFSRPPDPDPVAWFDAFENTITALAKRQASKHDPEDPAHREEIWEDAREHFNDS